MTALLEAIDRDANLHLSFSDPPESVSGGCIHQAWRIPTQNGSSLFLKVNTADKADIFTAEAQALRALAQTGTIRVPEPISTGIFETQSYLILEWISLHRQGDSAMMGRQLAALHEHTSENGHFGWHRDNVIGETPQSNTWNRSWPTFFAEERLAVQFELARGKGLVFKKETALLERLPEFFEVSPKASLLHGDLWSGNAAYTRKGEPVLFDPATYYGDRETDLAFTEMFGGFPPAFLHAYQNASPLGEGYEVRKRLYNLYHILNHHHLFGGHYGSEAARIIDGLC